MSAAAASRGFYGRGAELAALATQLARGDRVITVHGPPGVGKSRLVRELARRRRPSPSFLVRLASASTRDDVLHALAVATAGSGTTRDAGRRLDRVREHVDVDGALVVLDEVEHVLPVVREVIFDLLDVTDRVAFVLASRERLGDGDETLLPLRGLDDDAATALFLDRWQRLGAPEPDAETRADIAALVRGVGGLPLALELAASRARVAGTVRMRDEPLGPSELDRLVGAAWSSMPVVAQRALAHASVFRGTFDLDAAHAVLVPDVARDARNALLERLVDASLLEVAEGPVFRVLGPVRAFAAQASAEAAHEREEAVLRHATHHASRMLATVARGIDADDVWRRLAHERQDLLAAFDTLLVHDARRAAELALALDAMLVTQGPHALHRIVLARAIEATHDARVRAELLRARGRAAGLRGLHREAREDFEAALAVAELASDDAGAGWALGLLGYTLRALGALDEAHARCEAARVVAERLRDGRLLAMCEQSLGLVELARGDALRAADHERRAAAAARVARAPRLEGIAEANLAACLRVLGELDGADAAARRSRAAFEKIDDRFHLTAVVAEEAAVLVARGRVDEAEALLESSLSALQAHDDLAGDAKARAELARLAHARGDVELARLRVADAEALAGQIDDAEVRAGVAAARVAVLAAPRRALDPLVVTPDGGAFAFEGRTVDLARRGALRRILAALVEARTASPGERLDVEAVLRAGWPGEKMRPESGAARVYMAIRRLRSLGLERILLTRDDGYLMDPERPLRVGPVEIRG